MVYGIEYKRVAREGLMARSKDPNHRATKWKESDFLLGCLRPLAVARFRQPGPMRDVAPTQR